MSVETTDFQPIPASRAPVRTAEIQHGARLVELLFDVDRLTERMEGRKAVRIHNESVIRDALLYKPPLVQDIQEPLRDTTRLLSNHGYVREEDSDQGTVDDVVREKLNPFPRGSIRTVAKDVNKAKEIARQIAKAVHPDKSDAAVFEVMSDVEVTETLTRSLKAAEEGDVRIAQDVLLETMPQYYTAKIRGLLSQGLSFDEILSSEPQLIDELQNLLSTARQALPVKYEYRKFEKPEDADREAKRIRQEADLKARGIAVSITYGVLDDVVGFAQQKGHMSSQAISSLMDQMRQAAGMVVGVSEYVAQNGVFVEYGLDFENRRVEAAIQKLPQDILALAASVAVSSSNGPLFEDALNALKESIARLTFRARDQIEALRRRAEDRQRELSSRDSGPQYNEKIIKKLNENDFFEKENRYKKY